MEQQPPDYSTYYTKQQQQANREQAKSDRKKVSKHTAYTHLICQIGGIWLEYFPECKRINPYNNDEMKGIARAFATLAHDKQFLRLWLQIKEEMIVGGGG